MDRLVAAYHTYGTPQEKQKFIHGYFGALTQTPAETVLATLQTVDAARDTILAVYLLASVNPTTASVADLYISQAKRVFLKVDPASFEDCASAWATASRRFKDLAVARKVPPISVLLPLRRSVTATASKPRLLTPMHADFLQVAILAKSYDYARTLVDENACEIDPKTAIQPQDVLLYYYYAGIVYAVLKNFSRSAEMLLAAISMPAVSVSAIQLEAYKKYVLVSLLAFGSVRPLPRHTSSSVSRLAPQFAPAYVEFAELFAKKNSTNLLKFYTENAQGFANDRNSGLAQQCLAALPRVAVKELTTLYSLMPLAELAATLGLKNAQEAEELLFQMVASGELRAQINKQDHTVQFCDEDADSFSDGATLASLHLRLEQSLSTLGGVSDLNRAISLSTPYLQQSMLAALRVRASEDSLHDA
eukprot:TRINITY_DN7311_c0_g1_i1.p1 TRINITY_DN7311_c0_g1~~TRINITY_DN7311_c0_g1_i1.p1  ORF type:complete len:461 (-),score=116.18 TRINITY_DN7311_c0_g1_i1:871-2127(-)